MGMKVGERGMSMKCLMLSRMGGDVKEIFVSSEISRRLPRK
jgi:hypothetical protein